MRSPTIAEVSECASIAFSAERIINGFGLPTKYGSTQRDEAERFPFRPSRIVDSIADLVAELG
jgi:hypothetical protein